MVEWVEPKDPIFEPLRLSKGIQVFDIHRPECWSGRELVPVPSIVACPYGRASHGLKASGHLAWTPTRPAQHSPAVFKE